MAATTMQLTSLLKRLSLDYPELAFQAGEHFLWSPETRTVHYSPTGPANQLLHEVGHALLGHTSYGRDIELLAMERAAWEKARQLATSYDLTIDEDTIEDHLDTYRDWMHARSTCPNCTATGFQTTATTYSCPACSQSWKVNEARICQLRRTRLSPSQSLQL